MLLKCLSRHLLFITCNRDNTAIVIRVLKKLKIGLGGFKGPITIVLYHQRLIVGIRKPSTTGFKETSYYHYVLYIVELIPDINSISKEKHINKYFVYVMSGMLEGY